MWFGQMKLEERLEKGGERKKEIFSGGKDEVRNTSGETTTSTLKMVRPC